jgi:hypothetical protein
VTTGDSPLGDESQHHRKPIIAHVWITSSNSTRVECRGHDSTDLPCDEIVRRSFSASGHVNWPEYFNECPPAAGPAVISKIVRMQSVRAVPATAHARGRQQAAVFLKQQLHKIWNVVPILHNRAREAA